ncbi:MAG: MoxR family ATPase [Oscillospiraceae bacterium]
MNYKSTLDEISYNIGKIIVGKDETIGLVLMTLLAGGNILLEDVPGTGKTTLANALARSISCGFTRIQFTPDTLPGDVTGLSIYNMKTGKFEFSKGAVMNNIILADEINRTSPKTQASLLEAMEEKQVTVDGTTYQLPAPFMVIATQNPVDYLGTYNLPEAQLDRFLMKISIGYPDAQNERKMVELHMKSNAVKELAPLTDGKSILQMHQAVKEISVHTDLIEYVIKIVDQTRKNPRLSLGASPRATLAVIHAAQASAFYHGRDFVIPDDILNIIPYVLSHRLILSSEARINKLTAESVLSDIISRIKVPV